MPTLKILLKAIIPPVVISAVRLFNKPKMPPAMWDGDYVSWEAVQAVSTGYDDELILAECKNATLKVKNDEAVYERDSVLFDKKQYSWPLLAALENAALANSDFCVLDFGGSLGSTYYQNKIFLDNIKNLQWCVVEQPHFAKCGKKYIEDERLKFYDSIETCLESHKPTVILLSGVLQYLEEPYKWVKIFAELDIEHMIIDRTSFISGQHPRLTLQTVPKEIYNARYACWFFNEKGFLKSLDKKYEVIVDFDSFADPNLQTSDDKTMYWKGFFLKLKASC